MNMAALGSVLQLARAGRGWSVETAAKEAGLGHMTWRRIEEGSPVRVSTYSAVERLFELPVGTLRRALGDEAQLAALARRFGLDVPEAEAGGPPAEFATSLVTRRPVPSARLVSAMTAPGRTDVEPPLVVAVGKLATRLAEHGPRTEAGRDARRALLALLDELAETGA